MATQNLNEQIASLQTYVDNARRMVFFGGAGVSTESGIPDFRSKDGLYNQKYSVPPETILSHTYFMEHTDEFYRYYREKMLCLDAQPNAAHKKLAAWEKEGKLSYVLTQNIDGLHQKAGSRKVVELHGTIHDNFCMDCGAHYDGAWVQHTTGVPHCEHCGGIVKPCVVLYEESLDESGLQRAVYELSKADLLIVGGTSLTVYPAAGLIHYRQKSCPLVLINRDPTPADDMADLCIHGSIGEIFQQLT